MEHKDWLKATAPKQFTPMCGACKATGLEHDWNVKAELSPVEPKRPCKTCNGSGYFPRQHSLAPKQWR